MRSEFIPVLNLASVLPECEASSDNVMLVVNDAAGPWALLVDEVAALRVLETSDAPAANVFDAACVVVGWATHGSNVIQVLDQFRIRNLAEMELAEMWQLVDLSPQEFRNTKP